MNKTDLENRLSHVAAMAEEYRKDMIENRLAHANEDEYLNPYIRDRYNRYVGAVEELTKILCLFYPTKV